MCGAEAPAWRWLLLPFAPTLDYIPLGPGPYHVVDPTVTEREALRFGWSKEKIQRERETGLPNRLDDDKRWEKWGLG
jgi:hypothetical protein